MLFARYTLVVFRDGQTNCTQLKLRGWLVAAGVLAIVVLLGFNWLQWRRIDRLQHAAGQLGDSQRTVEQQRSQLLSLAGKLRLLERDLSRLRDFDSKLRAMVRVDPGKNSTLASSMGGAYGEGLHDPRDSSKNALTLYREELLTRRMHAFLGELSAQARLEEVRQQQLLEALRLRHDDLYATPSLWPTTGYVTSGFGWRSSPFTGMREFHKGLDIACALGTQVVATAFGVVDAAGYDGSYGLRVNISHSGGITTRYGHLSKVLVHPGQKVNRGEVIGLAGSTGLSTGPHVHYEVRLDGLPLNPERYILN